MRVLIADDHEILRRGLRAMLEKRGWSVCGEAVDGEDAIAKTRETNPDVIIMDISMPKVNGLAATRTLRQLFPHVKVLVLSQHDSAEMPRQALTAGARGYVTKTAISTQLIGAIERVHQGDAFWDVWALAGSNSAVKPDEILQRSIAMDNELRDSEERFRSIFEQAAVGVAQLTPDGRWIRTNRELREMLGYSEAELAQMKPSDFTRPEGRPAELAQENELLAGTIDAYTADKRYVRKDGSVLWVHRIVSAVRGADGKVKYLVGITHEIARHEFVRQEGHYEIDELSAPGSIEYEQRAERSAGGVFDWNIKLDRVVCTPELEALYGLPPGSGFRDLRGWEMLIYPEDLPGVRKKIEQAVQTGKLESQWRVIWPDGSIHAVQGKGWVLWDENGTPARLVGVVTDRAARKRAELRVEHAKRAMQTALADLEAVTRRMLVGVTRCSNDHSYLWANQAYADLVGHPLDQIIGHSIREVLGESAFASLCPYFDQVARGQQVTFEMEVTFRAAGRKWISAVYKPTFDERGAPDGWVGVVLDDTGRHKPGRAA